jgi:sugar phosphate isomerase/epimerase
MGPKLWEARGSGSGKLPWMKIAAQLYTVRDLIARDFAGTLRAVRSIGYQHVELAGHGPFKAAELQSILEDCGLTACSEHCSIDQLESNLLSAIEDAHVLKVGWIVCPYIPEERRRDEAGWKACAQILNQAGRICRENNIRLCYHNHSFEFMDLGGRTALELIYSESDPNHLQAELDTYWIRHGGGDPAAWLDRLQGRCPLLHLKDMAADSQRSFAPVGSGILDWPSIMSAADRVGVAWGIVEQDTCPGDPLECLRISLVNLASLV